MALSPMRGMSVCLSVWLAVLTGCVVAQVVPVRPITWCSDSDHPITILGNISWCDNFGQIP